MDEDNKKDRNKIGAKMKMLEAKPFDQNAENWKRENRLFTSTVLEAGASGQNRIGTHALRSHRTVWFVFAAQTLCFLLETCIADQERLLLAKWHPKAEKKKRRNGGFSTPLTCMKSCTVDRGCTPAPKDARKLVVFFRFFFESFLWHFNKKQRAEMIFRLSRLVWCKKNRKMARGSNDLSTLPLKGNLTQKWNFVSFWYLVIVLICH